MSLLKRASDAGEEANRAIGQMGMKKAAAILSEGFCPVCTARGVATAVTDFDEDERPATSVVNCPHCQIRWRSGPNYDVGGDWIEHTRTVEDGMRLTMTLNAPHDPPREEDDWW